MKIIKSSWWRLFDQAIYIYLISCWVESSCQVELSSQASQLDSSSWIQLLNLTQHFFKKISTWLNTFRVEYSTWRDQSTFNSTMSSCIKDRLNWSAWRITEVLKKKEFQHLIFDEYFFLNDLKNTIRSFLFQMKDKTEWDLFLVNELNISWLLVNEREIILLLVSRWETELLLSSEWETRLLLASELKTKLLLSSE